MDSLKNPKDLLIYVVIASVCSMLFEVEYWVSGVCFVLVAWKFLLKPPSRVITGTLAVVFFGAVYFQYRTLFGRDPSAHFLTILTCLKILENRDRRDEKFIFLLGIFMVIGRFLFTLDLFVTLLHLILLYFLLWSFLRIQTENVRPSFLIRQMIWSLPLTIFIFFLFPRFTYNFGGFMNSEGGQPGSGTGFSGFAESLKPGVVSQLFQSDELVFRAKFRGTDPRPNDLYWRGEVLELNDGFEWKKRAGFYTPQDEVDVSNSYREKNSLLKISADRLSYQVIIEPNQSRWAFSLERNLDMRGELLNEYKKKQGVYSFAYPLTKRQAYFGESLAEGFLSFNTLKKWNDQVLQSSGVIKDNSSKILLQTSPVKPAVEKLLTEFKKELPRHHNRLDRVKIILDYFAQKNFSYTLNPGSESQDLENFLFNGKKGFCEHYSAAFVILARSLNVPARVVVGYHGGTYNPVGGFWNITQKNAHAWAEVLLETGIWMRIDPTAVLPESQTMAIFNQASLSLTQRNSSEFNFGILYNEVTLFFDTLNYRWNEFFLDYGQQSQKDLYDDIANNLKNIGIALIGLLLIYFLFSKLFDWLKIRRKRKYIEGIYDELSTYLDRPASMGPQEWLERLRQTNMPSLVEAEEIIQAYTLKTYAMMDIPKSQIPGLQKKLKMILATPKNSVQAH